MNYKAKMIESEVASLRQQITDNPKRRTELQRKIDNLLLQLKRLGGDDDNL